MNAVGACSHCLLPIGRIGLQREVNGEAHQFCCYGCCLAYQVHHGEADEPEAAALLIRLGVGAFLAMFSFAANPSSEMTGSTANSPGSG